MTATKEPLGEALARLRRDAGLSLRQVQERTGIDRSLLSRIESGAVQKPGPDTLSRLAPVLGVTASALLTLAGYTTSQAEALPAIRPYLRTKYGHLSASAQDELAAFLERLEAEADGNRTGGSKTK
jgi:transcriptional regulator with XRE-family HTH domain